MDEESVIEPPHGQAIHITFDGEEGKFLLFLHSVRSHKASELSEEELDELREHTEVPDDIPGHMTLIENEVATAQFDSLEALGKWLQPNLDKLWPWLIGLETNIPVTISLPNH